LPRQLSHLDVPTITQLEIPCPAHTRYSVLPRTQDPGSRKQPYATPFDTRTPAQLANTQHELSPLQHPTPREPKHHPPQEPQPSHSVPLCPFAPSRKHHRHSTSNFDPLRQIPKPFRTEAVASHQISRCSLSVWSLGSGTALCCLLPSAGCTYQVSRCVYSNRAAKTNTIMQTAYPDAWPSDL
jgi:hypothetical protein